MSALSYFKQISDYRTYLGEEYDFHLDYNANSGGGQAFLGGMFADGNGDKAAASALNSATVTFTFRFHGSDGNLNKVDLDTRDAYRYPVSPRGSGSQQMKLSLGGGKVRPSLLLPAALMLPCTAAINMADSLEISPLTWGNYWLRSMWLDCEFDGDGRARFIPKDYVFSGGLSKQGKYAAEDGKPTGNAMFFTLNYERRANDILYASEHCDVLPEVAGDILRHFSAVLLGTVPFDHEECYEKTAELMSLLAHEYPTTYMGVGDPLPAVMKAIGRPASTDPMDAPAPLEVPEPRNLIFFGAPGTGKSHQLAKLAEKHFDKGNVRRVTFHPDYTYAQFVGCYKPVTTMRKVTDENGNESVLSEISYDFVPGPFLEIYISAVQNPGANYLLVVEEINRANPAAAFGDVFQLLDRDSDGRSEYEIAVPREMRDYLRVFLPEYATAAHIQDPKRLLSEQLRLEGEAGHLSLPPNMFIWATMNSADQGVFPMDTAFKRRWDFRYMGIDEGSDKISGYAVPVGSPARIVSWDALRRGINRVLLEAGVNEDKLLGPFFISPARLADTEGFMQVFKNKVLLYLFEDAAKTKAAKVFSHEGRATYSDVCDDFERLGELAFRGMRELPPVSPADADETEGLGAGGVASAAEEPASDGAE